MNLISSASATNSIPPLLNALPWVQDTLQQRTWIGWAIAHRDVIITDAFNRPVAKDNLTQHDLASAANRDALRAAFLKAATPVDSDHDRIPDDWEFGWFGNLNPTPEADPDQDGADNLAEFAFATNPVDRNSSPRLIPHLPLIRGTPALGLSLRRFSGGAVDFQVDASPDLAQWFEPGSSLQRSPVTFLWDGLGGSVVHFQLSPPAAPPASEFLRVRPVPKLPRAP